MNVTPRQLVAQYERAQQLWGHIIDRVERENNLPPFLLYAVGSRETNLDPRWARTPGDNGNGHGLWQIDKRYHQIPPDWRDNIEWQARKGAEVLLTSFRRCGTWLGALAAYNSGRCEDRFTTGKDYGRDTWERREYLFKVFGNQQPKRTERQRVTLHLLVA